MECHQGATAIGSEEEAVFLVGSPNVGKSALFGALTRARVTISNYPGTTIALSRGTLNGGRNSLYDTPGVYGLLPVTEDERITRDALLACRSGRIILVLDAKNLRRGLTLAMELAEMGFPFVVALNMEDEAQAMGLKIDHKALSARLGVPVVPTVATRGKGVQELLQSLEAAKAPLIRVEYPKPLADALEAVEARLNGAKSNRRFLALSLLVGEEIAPGPNGASLPAEDLRHIEGIRQRLTEDLSMPLRAVLMRARLETTQTVLEEALDWGSRGSGVRTRDRLGEWAMHPVVGPIILLAVLFGLYKFVGEFGAGFLVDLVEGRLFGEILNPVFTRWAGLIPFAFLRDLLVGPYGLITMGMTYALAIILPIVGTFFLAFGVLEDSGYLPRLSLLANRVFRSMGLNGKAVLPMVLGLGCDTMATLTARILETPKERILVTLLLALGVPCSAQLGVLLGMLGESSTLSILIWTGVVVGVIFWVGFLAARLLPGESSDFLVEIPPIRVPQISNVLVKTLARIEWYLMEAVPLFLLGTLLLFVLDRVGALAAIQVAAAPIVEGFLGLPRAATDAFLIGFLRRDYGAAGLFALAKAGELDPQQVLVSLVTITLFLPCVANFLIIAKERGMRTALAISAFIFPFAFLVGGALRWALSVFRVTL
jgi:ferrous iron transport protein B